MLYVTTRNHRDVYTAHKTLTVNYGPEGDRFIPFRLPEFDGEQIAACLEKSFSENVADILNLFFNTHLDSWDVEFAIGRYPTKLLPVGHRAIVAELWHNLENDFSYLISSLYRRVLGQKGSVGLPTNWFQICAGIAVLFGIYSELQRKQLISAEQPLDIAVPAGDFIQAASCFYAKQMGLPISCIICGCVEDDGLWELLHHGQLGASARPPQELERLVAAALGENEARHYAQCLDHHIGYQVPADMSQALCAYVQSTVVGSTRVKATIRNVYQTKAYILDPETAMAYSALQDYRTGGASAMTLLLSQSSPLRNAKLVAEALDITQEALLKMFSHM